nr:uncharacterized protein LOC106991031 [Ovis aries]
MPTSFVTEDKVYQEPGGLRSGDTWEPESLSGPGALSGGFATGGAGWTPACRALNADDKPFPRSPGRGLDPLHPLPRLLPSAGRSQEGCTRGRPFKSASLRLQAAQADGPQLLRRHQSRPPGPDRVAGGAGEPGGRQVWADSPFIPRLGRAQTSGRPCSPCGACLYRAWRPGEGRGCGERGAREAAPWGPADTEPPSWPDCVTSGLSLPSSVPRLPQQPSSLPRKPLHSVDSQPMAHRGSPVCCCFSPET